MMMNCRQATELMSQQMDRPLTTKERLALRFHLMMCSGCRNFDHQMHDLRKITRVYAKGVETPDTEKPGKESE